MNSESLELALGDERVRIPWDGQSPRALTRVANSIFLRRKPQKDAWDVLCEIQYDLWPAAKTAAPPVWGGSPSLLPLPDRRS